ncbi:hypothetical protein [Bradyrhizobium sp. AZCC 2289]|uniref:hypothetical protein n=1 Tax=Bradyrhizobium sp. AZCC 2289 TaxID=3117026 RepID=UPI002FEEE928
MATPAQNQEIQLGFGERPQGNAATLFGPNIFVIGGDDKSDIQQSIYAAATGFTASSLGNKVSWSNSRLALPDSFSPQTKGTCALAIQSLQSLPALYLFWAQPNAGVMATSATEVTQPSSGGTSTSPTVNWSAGLVLCDDNQAIMPAPDAACVSAVSLGSQAFLVAFPSGGNPFNLGAIGLYYVADQLPSTMTTTLAGTFGIWPARAMRAFSALEIGELLPTVAGRSGNSFGNMCSIAVTPQVNGTSADGNNPLLLNLVMLLTLTMEDHSGKTPFQVAVTCPLDDTGSPLTAPSALAWSSTPTTKSPLTLLSDPAGRLVASGSSLEGGTKQEEDSLVFHLFNTYAQLQYLAQTTQSAQSSNTSTPATSLFIVDTSNPKTTTSQNVTANGTMTSTSYPLWQLVFYGGTTVAQAITYGSAVSMANYSNIALTTQDGGSTVVVTGIIDGPLPMPAANVIGWQFEGTSNDLGSMVYGTKSTQQSAAQQTVNIGLSLTSEGQVGIWAGGESLGDGGSAGVAWDFALNWSAAATWGSSSTSTAAVEGQQTSMVSVVKDAGVPVSVVKDTGVQPVTPQIGQAVVPSGTFWSAGSSVSITNIKFLDAQGKTISDGSQSVGSYAPQAPIFASSTPEIGTSAPNPYIPFMVTPGDLMTYTIDGPRPDGTPCGINVTMAALTNGDITDYFGTVIWPAAFDFAVGSDTPQKFLEFSWGLGAVSGEAFTAVQGTMDVLSWNIQGSMAAGLYWDVKAGVPFFGGLENKGNLMIGGSAGYASSTTTTASDEWGVTIAPFGTSPPWGPPNWGVVPAEQAKTIDPNWENDVVAQYTFALLFLPDPSSDAPAPLCPGYWVQELIKYGDTNSAKHNPANYLPNNLDPGSGCWRIVYVVLAIQTYADLNNDPPTYTYKCTDPRFN